MSAANPAKKSKKSIEQEHANWKPKANPWAVSCSVMIATFMVVLDSSVANVALPHIAGTLSASNDESTWVLTSYLVANAVMLPAAGWLARRIGRKRLLLFSILLFTFASILCGMAFSMPMLLAARILQGIGGGGMQPLAQSIMLESFPPAKHGKAMAVYGMGVVVAPIIGPTLGGWITDSYSWRWIFYINIPFGLLALFLVNLNVEDPPYLRHGVRQAIDYLGFGLMTLWLASLQLLLDKGQEADWFDASWICWVFAVSLAALVAFVARELMTGDPILNLRVLANRDFLVGTVIMTLYSFALYGVTALLPLFLQTLMGYPALDSGMAVSPRGIGAIFSMVVAGYLANRVDGRLMLSFGLFMLAVSCFMLGHINLQVSMASVVIPNIVNGLGTGFIFVPLTTLTLSRLRKQEIGNATGVYNLIRNIGGSVGIACVTTLLVRGAQQHQSYLGANITAGSPLAASAIQALQGRFHEGGASVWMAQREAVGTIYRSIVQQATLLSYADDFRFVGYLGLACIPLLLLFHGVRRAGKR